MSLASRKLIQATAGAAGAVDTGDDDFANVVLLLDGDGTSGDDNNTFTDSSTNGFTVTESGSVVQGSFSPYGDNWSNYFDVDLLSTSFTAIGSSDFTLEFWAMVEEDTTGRWFAGTGTGTGSFQIGAGSGGKWSFYTESNVLRFNGTTSIAKSTWYHVAVSRSGSTIKLFINGSEEASATDSVNYSATSLGIGGYSSTNASCYGYISNFRIVVGTALYTSAFTPPTTPLTAVTNTKLLTCQSNRFVDNSSDGNSISIQTGTPKVTPFSPFKDDDARDITTDGGSGYFDGTVSTNKISLADNDALSPEGDDFTLEAWVYTKGSAFNDYQGIWIKWTAGNQEIFFSLDPSLNVYAALWFGSNVNITSANAIEPYSWNHVAITRSGTTVTLWINGNSEATTTVSGTITNDTDPVYIGNYKLTGFYEFNGYISDVRWVKGAAVYTSAFTPPTAPLSVTAGFAYSISAASYTTTFSVATQDTAPRDVFFKPDGTKMYVVGAAFGNIYQYSLSTAWDVSTATYDSKSLSTSNEETTPTGMFFKPDGTSIIIVGSGNDSAFQYDLTTAWDVSTGSYASKSFDLSTQGTVPNGVALKPDGTKMFVIDDSTNNVFQYSLSTGWDLSTASYDSVSASVTSQASNPMSLEFNADGTKMYISDRSLDRLHEYILSTAWSVSSITHIATFKVNAYELNPSGVRFGDSGTKLYTSGYSGDAIDQYSVFSDSTLLLNFQDAGIYDRSGINNIDTVGNAQIDTAVTKYGTGSMEFDGTGDYCLLPASEELAMGTGDFTIEMWVNLNSATDSVGSQDGVFVEMRSSGATANGFVFNCRPSSTSFVLNFYTNGGANLATTGMSYSTWHHIAVTRESGTVRLFVNGTVDKTFTKTNDFSDTPNVTIGQSTLYSSSNISGYIDDLRITKGVARYTANFTPPTAELPKF